MHKYFSKSEKLLRVCVRCCLSLQRNPLSYFYFRKLHQKTTYTEFLLVSIDYITTKPLFSDCSTSSHANSFSDTQTRMRFCVSGSLRIPGCFFPPAALWGNTQSVINHGRCLWEGSGTFLLHWQASLPPAKESHVNERHTQSGFEHVAIMCCITYIDVLTHYGHSLCTHKYTHSFMHTRSYIRVCDTLNIQWTFCWLIVQTD